MKKNNDVNIIGMEKKTWHKPVVQTLSEKELKSHIIAAARSGSSGACTGGFGR